MNMNNKIIAGLACLLIFASLGGYTFWQYKKTQEAKAQEELVEAVDFATDAVNSMTAAWDPKELQKRAHPALLDVLKKSGLSMDVYFNALRQLGKLKDGKCDMSEFVTPKDAHFTLADYVCNAQFEHSPGRLVVEIRRDEGQKNWLISTFRVESPLFNPPAAQAAPAQ